MGISSPLLLKGIVGTAGIATVSFGGIYVYKSGFFSSSNPEPLITKWDEALIKKIKASDLQITSNPENFPTSIDSSPTTISFTASIPKEGNVDAWIWECAIEFKKSTNPTPTHTALNDDEKNLLDKDSTGFLQKIKSSDNKKQFKEYLVRKCAEVRGTKINALLEKSDLKNLDESLTKPQEGVAQENGKVKSKVSFTLIDSIDSKLKIKEAKEYEDWFKEIRLTKHEKEIIENSGEWKFTLAGSEANSTLTLGNMVNKETTGSECIITGNNAGTIKDPLEKKLSKSNKHYQKYRRGFLEKCRNSNNKITLDTSTTAADISGLFNLTREELNSQEKQLKSGKWEIKQAVKEDKKATITITASKGSESMTCEIVGTKSSDGNIDDGKFTKFKTSLETTLKGKIGDGAANKESSREKFLTKCKQSFDETIKLTLADDNDTNGYSLTNLDSQFS